MYCNALKRSTSSLTAFTSPSQFHPAALLSVACSVASVAVRVEDDLAVAH